MKTYKLTATITHTVEAENEEQALEKFYELESQNTDDLYPEIEEED
jgi:hypothetical protein